MQFRTEHKYIISARTAKILKSRVRAVMRPDPHGNGAYTVHNLYLDDRYDSFYCEKLQGSLVRDKYRLRFYNGDLSFIRLERKHKEGLKSFKESALATPEQYRCLLEGNMDFLLSERGALWETLGHLHRLRTLRPAAAFTYRREAYIYEPGNVRVTFDSRLAQNSQDPNGLLELKFTRFLPAVIAGLFAGLAMEWTEMSKYAIAREKGFNVNIAGIR